MPFFALQNFRFGLDVRRSEYTSQPGTLLQLDNAHINEGGEIEKRMAFTQQNYGVQVFGLVPGASGIYVFGSTAVPGGNFTLVGGVYQQTMFGITVFYQQCVHPDGSTAMASFVSGTTFAGLPFIAVKFTDGNVYCYYNGALVNDFTTGLILASFNSNAKIAAALAAQFPTYNYTSTYTASNTFLDVFGTPGGGYTVTDVVNSALGTVTTALNGPGSPNTQGQVSTGQFQIVAGATGSITSIKIDPSGTNKEILGATVNWTLSNGNTATLVAKQINVWNLSHTTGYVATSDSLGNVIISTQTQATTANGFVIKVTATVDVCIGNCALLFSYAVTPTGALLKADTTAGVYSLYQSTTASSANSLLKTGATSATFNITWGSTYNGITINSASTLAAAVAYQCQQYSATSGFAACAVGPTVYFSKLITQSNDDPIQINCIPVSGSNIVATFNPNATLTVVVSPKSASIQQGNGFPLPQPPPTGVFVGTVTGGTGPYSYLWVQTTQPTSNPNVVPSTNGGPSTSFYHIGTITTTEVRTITYVLQVTDSTGLTVISNQIVITLIPRGF